MREQAPTSHPKELVTRADIHGFNALSELALDMRWSWNHATDQVWQQLDPVLWKITHNPWPVQDHQRSVERPVRPAPPAISRETVCSTLYDMLEGKVIPEFYTRDEEGIPHAWVERMSESMARLTPHFSTSRAVREYTEQHYLPAATAYRARTADKGKIGAQVVEWQHSLAQHWSALHFGELTQQTAGDRHVFEVHVYLDDLAPETVRVDLYANGLDGNAAERIEMQRVRQLVGALNGYAYHAEVPVTRPATDYTARIIPHLDAVAVPLEEAHILWPR